MQVLVTSLAAVLGLVVGSFANVPIHRWPNGATVTQPRRSTCPSCARPIRARDNVPVASWLLLRGRCRDCDAPISPRYLVVEMATAVLFGAVGWVWGLDVLLPTLLVFTWTAVVATAIDLEHRIIPNRMTLRLPLVLLPLLVVAALVDGDLAALRRGVITGLAVPTVMFLLSELFRILRGQAGIGMGDVKYAISIGLVVGYLGALHVVVFAYATIFSAVLVGVALVLLGRARLASRIPFGPYLAIGAMVTILAGEPLTDWLRGYLGL